MTLAIAPFSPPIAATATGDGLPRIVLAVRQQGTRVDFLSIDTDGRLEVLDPSDFTFDFRWNGRDWIDPTETGGDDDEA